VIELLGGIATAIAIIGVILNNRRARFCFVFWITSNILTFGIHAHVALWSLAMRDIIFLILTIEGFYLWKKKEAPTK
jgi:nicotinamide riboside transporter PnuC